MKLPLLVMAVSPLVSGATQPLALTAVLADVPYFEWSGLDRLFVANLITAPVTGILLLTGTAAILVWRKRRQRPGGSRPSATGLVMKPLSQQRGQLTAEDLEAALARRMESSRNSAGRI